MFDVGCRTNFECEKWDGCTIIGAVTTSASLLGLVLLSFAAPGDDWPGFLGPTRDGVYAGPSLAHAWGEKGPPSSGSMTRGRDTPGPPSPVGA